MPSFKDYKKSISNFGETIGQHHKSESDMVMEYTWYHDINHRTAYLFDYYHDTNKLQLRNFEIDETDANLVPIEIKFLANAQQTMDKDQVTFHIQMKPGQECNVDYYEKFFAKRYDAIFPCGLYILIPDEQGVYHRWMVVAKANFYKVQFPTFEVLPCDKVFRWIHDGKKYEMAGVLRSQSSYNSGVWLNYKVEEPEDQEKFIVPLNRDSEHIFYNKRFILDNNVITEPRAWRITKINRVSNNGTVLATLAQDLFDQHKDYVELDDDGEVVAMWADYYKEPLQEVEEDVIGEITFSGLKSELKVNGGYKKFTINYEDDFNYSSTGWKFYCDGESISDLVTVLDGEQPNQIKVRFDGDSSYIGKTMELRYSYDGLSASLNVSIVAL